MHPELHWRRRRRHDLWFGSGMVLFWCLHEVSSCSWCVIIEHRFVANNKTKAKQPSLIGRLPFFSLLSYIRSQNSSYCCGHEFSKTRHKRRESTFLVMCPQQSIVDRLEAILTNMHKREHPNSFDWHHESIGFGFNVWVDATTSQCWMNFFEN